MIEIQTERIATLKKQTDLLIDWLREQGIKYDNAMPVLGMTIGMILRLQCRGVPPEVRDAHLMQGVDIAYGFVLAAAFEMPQQAADLLKETHQPATNVVTGEPGPSIDFGDKP
jgi:hypothetical protein